MMRLTTLLWPPFSRKWNADHPEYGKICRALSATGSFCAPEVPTKRLLRNCSWLPKEIRNIGKSSGFCLKGAATKGLPRRGWKVCAAGFKCPEPILAVGLHPPLSSTVPSPTRRPQLPAAGTVSLE